VILDDACVWQIIIISLIFNNMDFQIMVISAYSKKLVFSNKIKQELKE